MSLVTEEQIRTLRFFAITPDNRRIPTSEICSDPVNNVMRYLRRAFVVVAAVKPNHDIYWTQLFYCSTGGNSGYPQTWFPCDGVIDKHDLKSTSRGLISATIPFGYANKIPYTTPEVIGSTRSFIFGRSPPPTPIPKILNKTGLFEGDNIRDRFGSPSQELASQSFGNVSGCYNQLVSGGSDNDPNDINEYMMHYDAASIARFRKLGVFIPMFPGIDEQQVQSYYDTIEEHLAELEITHDPTKLNKALDGLYDLYQQNKENGGGGSSATAAPMTPPRIGGKKRKTIRRQRKTKYTHRKRSHLR